MKRIVIGTFSQCMEIVRKSEYHGYYDYYEMAPTTEDEWFVHDHSAGPDCVFFTPPDESPWVKLADMYTLNLYCS